MGLVSKRNFGNTCFHKFFIKLLCFLVPVLFLTQANSEDVRYSHDKALVSIFNTALVSLSKGELDQAEGEISNLKDQASTLGYSELSEFSFRLLRSASAHKGPSAERKQMLNMAESLSPNHPGVLLAISGYSESLTAIEQLKYIKNGLLKLRNYPLTTLSITIRLFTALSLAVLLSSFVVMLIILISSMSELVSASSKLFHRKNRQVGGVVISLLAIVVPGLFPLTVAMVLWSFLLLLALPRFWWMAVTISFFSFYLDFVLEPSLLLTSFSESPSSRALESIANSGFTPRIVDYVDDEVSKESSNPVWHLILGQIFQSRGDDNKALESYERARQNIGKEKSISFLIAFNKAVHLMQIGETERGFNELMDLKAQGWNQFEILFNLSLASTILHKPEVYDQVFKEMQSRYFDRLETILSTQGDAPTPILGSLPNNFFLELVSFELGRIYKLAKASVDRMGLLKILIYLFVAIWGAYKGLFRKSLRYSRTFVNQRLFVDVRRNKFWSYIPLGWAIREGRLLALYLYLNLFILLIILMNGQPIKLFVESDRGISSIYQLLILLFLLGFKPFGREAHDA